MKSRGSRADIGLAGRFFFSISFYFISFVIRYQEAHKELMRWLFT